MSTIENESKMNMVILPRIIRNLFFAGLQKQQTLVLKTFFFNFQRIHRFIIQSQFLKAGHV